MDAFEMPDVSSGEIAALHRRIKELEAMHEETDLRVAMLDGRGEPITQWFAFDHLPDDLKVVSRDCHVLADIMEERLPDCEEKLVGLRKLLEAKDCFVRAALIARGRKENLAR